MNRAGQTDMIVVLKASEQLLYDGVQISDELNTFYAQSRTNDDVQVCLQTSLKYRVYCCRSDL